MTHPVTIQNNNLTRDKKIPGWVFDEGKTHLTITQLNEKISLSKLPPSLEKLTLVDNDGLESIDLEGCSNLEELTVQECSNFSEIKNLDQCTRLRSLTLSRAWHLKNNERPLNLPPSLEILIVHSSDGLSLNKENIPDLLLLETCHENLREISEIPKSLEALHLWHCEGSIGLNSYDFPNLKTLELHGNLTAVTALPKSLRTLHVFNPNLTLLNLTNCRELLYVDLENCQSLNPDPILLMQLDEIENDHRSRVVLPRH